MKEKAPKKAETEKKGAANPFANLPSVDSVLNDPALLEVRKRLSPRFVTYCVRRVLERFRRELAGDVQRFGTRSREEWLRCAVSAVQKEVSLFLNPTLRRVVNATGVILHTGLGRAPLPEEAREQMARVSEHYCALEFDLEEGKRGERLDHVEPLLRYLSGAEAAAVVNNNAAAVLLALNTLARGKEVIVSRGQLIEIGGSFRLPDVMAQSGAVMREIGTTNKTHLRDYERAIGPATGAILVAHTSNYRVLGFTEEVPVARLVPLAQRHGIPLIYDLGGGVFLDLRRFDLPHEPVVPENVKLGVDVVTFSGDKVLGGPQSGILVGKRKYIEAVRKNPLMRALRCDKLILAALAATLRAYLFPDQLAEKIPVLRMLLEPVSVQKQRGRDIMARLGPSAPRHLQIELGEDTSQIGSGALPLAQIPSGVLWLSSSRLDAGQLARHFRLGEPPVVGYIRGDRFCLNLRTVRDDEISLVAERIRELAS